MVQLFDSQLLDDLRNFPDDKPVMIRGSRDYSAKSLYANAQNIAIGLRDKGLAPGDRVLLLMRPDEDFCTVIYALGMLGSQVALVDPEMGRQHFESKMVQFDPQWVFADRGLLLLAEHPLLRMLYLGLVKTPFYVRIPKRCRVVSTGGWLPLLRPTISLRSLFRKKDTEVNWIHDAQRPFLVTYTSGTLDEPKGVVHTFASLHESICRVREIPGFSGTIGAYLSHFLLIGISTGNTVCMFDKRLDPEKRLALFAEKGVAILFGPPSDFIPGVAYCRAAKRVFPSGLKLVLLGSAPVYPAFLKQLRSVLHRDTLVFCTYGMTENLLVSVADADDKCAFVGLGDYLGKPVSGVNVEIASDGEICIQSPQLFQRYWHDTGSKKPHATGDLGYIDLDGALIMFGRKKDMIIRRDMNIYPSLYEKTILSIPGVKDCAMVGVYNNEKHDEEVWLYVDVDNDLNPDVGRALRTGPYAIDKEALPDYIVYEKIPRTGRQNKIDRKELLKKHGL